MTLVAGTLAGSASKQAPDATLIASERALLDAVAAADAQRFRALTLPEGVWTTPTGFVPMAPLAGALDTFVLPQWRIENPHVVWSDGNSALLLYIRTGGGRFGDRRFADTMLASTLWAKRGGKWVAVHHQENEYFP